MITFIEQLLEIYKVESEEELNWNWISIHQKLSEEFIEKHSDKVNWFWISKFQILSEEFIEKHSDKVNWYCISAHQTLSESFIEKYSDKVDWGCISIFQKLSKELLKKHWEKIPILSVVKKCGNQKKIIYRFKKIPDIIHIGCFSGTKEEVIKAIKKKYSSDSVAMQQYIDKVEECFNITLID